LLFVYALTIPVATGVFVATSVARGGGKKDTSGNSDGRGKKTTIKLKQRGQL
jgi:hypothetical protein